MIVKPKMRYEFGDAFVAALNGRDPSSSPIGVRTLPSSPTDGVFVECVVVTPPSSEGRNVTLWLDPDAVDRLLIELRDNARERRR